MLKLGWHWKGDGGEKTFVFIWLAFIWTSHTSLQNNQFTTSVYLTTTSRHRNAAEYTDLIMSIMHQLLIETSQKFGKREFRLFFDSIEQGAACLLNICNGPLFILWLCLLCHTHERIPAVRLTGTFSLDSPRSPRSDCVLSTSHMHWPLTLTGNNKPATLDREMLVGKVQICRSCGLCNQLFVHGVGFPKEKTQMGMGKGPGEEGHVNPASVPLY